VNGLVTVPDVRVRMLPTDALEPVAAAWVAVEVRCPHVPLAASWAWTATWLRHYGDTVRARVAVVEHEGEPCAVALLTWATRRTASVPVRTLHLGTAGEPAADNVCVEYNDLLCVPGAREIALQALTRAIASDRGWDELRIDGGTDDALAARMADVTPGGRLLRRPEPSRYYDLTRPGLDADIASALPSGPRRRLRASLRAFAARGELRVEWPDDATGALAILDELAERHQRRWEEAGEPGSFASDRFRAFHRQLVAEGVGTGAAAVVRVRSGDDTVGCLYLLRDGDRALFYQSGLARFDDNRLRPGLVAHAMAMQACRERGFAAYDFLAGDVRYKRDLATDHADLVWTRMQRPRLRLRGLAVARDLRNRARPRSGIA
jgi:CelD/BcsL family acetyltransferase involved in cellulose biosynthesis